MPSVIKTNIPLTEDPAQPEEDLWQRYEERLEKLSQQDRVSKFCRCRIPDAHYSGEFLHLRARNLVDPLLQDNVVIPDDFFKYIYHVGCAINLHSIIINSGLIPGGQNLRK